MRDLEKVWSSDKCRALHNTADSKSADALASEFSSLSLSAESKSPKSESNETEAERGEAKLRRFCAHNTVLIDNEVRKVGSVRVFTFFLFSVLLLNLECVCPS